MSDLDASRHGSRVFISRPSSFFLAQFLVFVCMHSHCLSLTVLPPFPHVLCRACSFLVSFSHMSRTVSFWQEFHGLWDTLVYDIEVKSHLLDYAQSAMYFADKRVDPNIVAWNRVVLLHGARLHMHPPFPCSFTFPPACSSSCKDELLERIPPIFNPSVLLFCLAILTPLPPYVSVPSRISDFILFWCHAQFFVVL